MKLSHSQHTTSSRHKKSVISFFDTEYHWWTGIYEKKSHKKFLSFEMGKRKIHIVALIKKYAGENENLNVLECGCGPGGILKDIAGHGYNITGVDINYRFLSIAGNNLPNKLNLIQSDVENLPFKDSAFDIAYCAGVLSYLENDHSTISEISRVVKPSGIVLIALPNLFPFYKFIDPYYILGIIKYICKKRYLKKNETCSEKTVFCQHMIRRYYYGKLSSLFKTFSLREIKTINVSFGPITFLRKEIFPLFLSIKLSEFLVEISHKKIFSFLRIFASRWIVCLEKVTSIK